MYLIYKVYFMFVFVNWNKGLFIYLKLVVGCDVLFRCFNIIRFECNNLCLEECLVNNFNKIRYNKIIYFLIINCIRSGCLVF